MLIANYNDSVLFEHRFWLQILGDHGRFIKTSLAPDEKETIQQAQYFINLFDHLLEKSRSEMDMREVDNLNKAAYSAALSIRSFKLSLIGEHLVEKIKIELPPTFINHMVNEVEEYITILLCIFNNQYPSPNPIHHHLLWLPDASGHAAAIASKLDPVEKPLIKRSKNFIKAFDDLHLKSIEEAGFMRTNICEFPALGRLNNEAESEILCFSAYLKELEGLVREKKVLSTLLPILLDHMYREECYYLTKLSQVTDIPKPSCDPTKHRNE